MKNAREKWNTAQAPLAPQQASTSLIASCSSSSSSNVTDTQKPNCELSTTTTSMATEIRTTSGILQQPLKTYGLKWANNSCSPDTVLTTLFHVSLTLREAERDIVYSALRVGPLFAAMVGGGANNTMRSLRDALMALVYDQQGATLYRINRGLYCGVRSVWSHIMNLESSQLDTAFRINVIEQVSCPNAPSRCRRRNSVRAAHSNDSDYPPYSYTTYRNETTDTNEHFTSVQQSLQENLRVSRGRKRPETCTRNECPDRPILKKERFFNSFPLIFYIEVPGTGRYDYTYPVDRNLKLHDINSRIHSYDLVAVIYYSTHPTQHFISRFLGCDNNIYEYDGMKRDGECLLLHHDVTDTHCFNKYFSRVITTADLVKFEMSGIIYTKSP